jgi:hypothetical protein
VPTDEKEGEKLGQDDRAEMRQGLPDLGVDLDFLG